MVSDKDSVYFAIVHQNDAFVFINIDIKNITYDGMQKSTLSVSQCEFENKE